MSFWYTPAKERLAKGDLDFDEAGNDIRVLLAMTNTTADTDQDAGTLAAIGTLDEYDGAGYSRAALAAQSVVRDDANNRAEIMATSPVSFGATVAAGTRSAQGAVVYRHVDGTAANDQPIAWIDTGGFPLNGGGGPFELAINAEGLLQIT
jgi:hypothetical protein